MTDSGQCLHITTNLVIFTSTCEQMKGYWLNHYFPKMIEKSIAQMPSLKFIEDNLSSNGFEIVEKEKYFIQEDLEDCFLYAGKNRPQIYFNEEIRKGISSFSSLANIEEVYSGLANLKQDMENNNFEKIKKQYENNMGDYLFIHAQKQVNIRHS